MQFLTKLERAIRRRLKRHPLLYAFVAGVGVVLFWRGVWHFADFLALNFISANDTTTSIDWASGLDSALSLVVGGLLLLSTGLFVSELLSGEVLITRTEKEEEITGKTEKGVERESAELPHIEEEIHHIAKEIEDIEKDLHARGGERME